MPCSTSHMSSVGQHVEAGQVGDRVGVVEPGAEGDQRAAVVAGQGEALVAERAGQRDDVGGHRALGVGRAASAGLSLAP